MQQANNFKVIVCKCKICSFQYSGCFLVSLIEKRWATFRYQHWAASALLSHLPSLSFAHSPHCAELITGMHLLRVWFPHGYTLVHQALQFTCRAGASLDTLHPLGTALFPPKTQTRKVICPCRHTSSGIFSEQAGSWKNTGTHEYIHTLQI